MQRVSKALVLIFSISIVGCGGGSDSATPLKTAIREFKDGKNSSVETQKVSVLDDLNMDDVLDLRQKEGLYSNQINLDKHSAYTLNTNTRVKIYVYKYPSFYTYLQQKSRREIVGHKKQILLLVVDGKLQWATYVSTGNPNRKAWNSVRKKHSYGTDTPVGTFRPDFLSPNHKSRSYGNAPMKWSIFFKGGIALHQTSVSTYNDLGKRASMGCIRLNHIAAYKVYQAVRSFGKSQTTVFVKNSGARSLFSEEQILNALDYDRRLVLDSIRN